MVFPDDLGQRLAEVAHQGAADAAGVHLSDVDARILEEAAIDADLTEFILDENQLLACVSLLNHFLDQRGLACAKKTGVDIDFCHLIHLLYIKFLNIVYHFFLWMTSHKYFTFRRDSL